MNANIDNITNTTVAAIAMKKAAFGGSSLLGGMIIFQDMSYIAIALMGAFVSVGSAYYDINKMKEKKKKKNEPCVINTKNELLKAWGIGFLFSLLSFLLFLQVGGEVMKKMSGVDWFNDMLPSFWLVLTVALATEAPTMWDKAKTKLIGKKDSDD